MLEMTAALWISQGLLRITIFGFMNAGGKFCFSRCSFILKGRGSFRKKGSLYKWACNSKNSQIPLMLYLMHGHISVFTDHLYGSCTCAPRWCRPLQYNFQGWKFTCKV